MPDQGSRLEDLLRLQEEATEDVARAAAQLKRQEAKLRVIENTMIPEALAEMGADSVTLTDGTKVTVEEVIKASIPKDKRQATYDAIEAAGHGDVVKRRVAVQFAAGQDDSELIEELRARELPVERETKVEPSTLSALVRELISEGEPVPDGVKVYRQKKAVIKRP